MHKQAASSSVLLNNSQRTCPFIVRWLNIKTLDPFKTLSGCSLPGLLTVKTENEIGALNKRLTLEIALRSNPNSIRWQSIGACYL